MNKKTAKKWQKVVAKEKIQKIQNTTAILMKTHERSHSEAEILVPMKYKDLIKPENILIIQVGKDKMYVQPTSLSIIDQKNKVQQKEKAQISILKNVVDLYEIQCGDNGVFRGQIRVANQKNILPEMELQYAQLIIRNAYFSRRDQYKVSTALSQRITHVYSRKMLYFQNSKVQVTNMMKNNEQYRKTGLITKNTKLIFRSACAKSTILVQLSKQTFDLNPSRQLYLQKMIQVIIIYFHRNNFFNNKHRIQIVLYARLFYPQFNTLTEAYQRLKKQATIQSSQNKFQVNFAVTLQRDYRGRVYQDVYRKIHWESSLVDSFKKYFLQKVSEFMFTLNWDYQKNRHSQFIAKSINQKVKSEFNYGEIPTNWKIKPFIHRMRCQLASSSDSNIFQAICLISEQYKHHYKFRSLDQTGNSIIILSAGTSQYQVDRITYKMTKSYIYLTNINCMLVNVNKKVQKIKARVFDVENHLFKKQRDVNKLKNLIHWCIQQFVYLSPVNQRIKFDSHKVGFQMKSMIVPQAIQPIQGQEAIYKQTLKQVKCQCKQHFYLKQSPVDSNQLTHKTKELEWINSYYMNNEALKIHEYFYEKAQFKTNFYQSFNKNFLLNQKNKEGTFTYGFLNELSTFQDDLQKIVIKKERWLNFGAPTNILSKKLNKYINFSVSVRHDKSTESKKQMKESHQMIDNTNRHLFQIQCLKKQHLGDFQTSSNQDPSDRLRRMDDFQAKGSRPRNNSNKFQEQQNTKKKINIFQQTYKNQQYKREEINQKKAKKTLSHNKQRLRANYKQSNIHYLKTYFNEPTLKKITKFFRKQFLEPLTQQQIKINDSFEFQKQWKALCFPILTPIFTKYKENFIQPQYIPGQTNDNNFQDEICKLLMQNYQISQISANKNILKLSKGHIVRTLQLNDKNLTKGFTIDRAKQKGIVPFLLYRYLCYEQKDYRFCSKSIYFQDRNFYDKQYQGLESQTKSLKILFLFDQRQQNTRQLSVCLSSDRNSSFLNSRKSPIHDFQQKFKQKFPQYSFQIKDNQPKQIAKKKSLVLSLLKQNSKNSLYLHQQITCHMDIEFNPKNLFKVVVEWDNCSSVLVNEFVENLITIGRRTKFNSFLITTEDVFNIGWSMNIVGQIVFSNELAVQMIEHSILQNDQWYWDSQDFYMDIKGIAFIKFRKDKKLILWKDNNYEKKNRQPQLYNEQYHKFFMLSAAFDFLGECIQQSVKESEIKKLMQESKVQAIQLEIIQSV